MSTKPVMPANPERGWGQMLPLYLQDSLSVHNHGSNGKSTRSFRERGLWEKVSEKVRSGDWLIIQFGHNDAAKNRPSKSTDPETFGDNLKRYIVEARHMGVMPVLATPIPQRRFSEEGRLIETMKPYVAMTRKVARELDVPLLEVRSAMMKLIEAYGPERSKQLFLWNKPGDYASRPDGVSDDTHLSAIGASRVAEIVVSEIERLGLPLADWLN